MWVIVIGLVALAAIADEVLREIRSRLGFLLDVGLDYLSLDRSANTLSGGEAQRVAIGAVLTAQPRLLILDEPTNDVDTDMLAAMEDLLDSWPGTLIVVSHDRYLLERVTDQQYGIFGRRLRHLPGGVDEYLRRADEREAMVEASPAPVAEPTPGLSGAQRHALEKELSSLERRMGRISGEVGKVHERLAAHDPSDFEGLQALTAKLGELETENADLEEQWLELSERIEG